MFSIFKRRKTDPEFIATESWKRRRMHKRQRIERGWSEIDAWYGDMYLAKVIYQMLEHHKTLPYIPGAFLPDSFESYDIEASDETHIKWHKVLDESHINWLKVLDDIVIPLKKYATHDDHDYTLEESVKIYEDARIAMHLFADNFHNVNW